MLLALAARSLRSMLVGKDASLPLTDLPRFAHEQLGLHGLMLSADLLAGRTRDDLVRLRDAADRARCSCLVLLEEDPQKLAAADPSAADERVRRVMAAASLLGCNAAGVAIDAPDTPGALESVAERLKALMAEAEQREINLLILPSGLDKKGQLTASPERLTELLKKIGGFRVGTMPDFAHAAQTEDPPAYLRRVTPYASAVLGTTLGFKAVEGELDDERAIVEHEGFDLAAAVEAISAVGYDGAVGLDYRGAGDLRMGLRRSREGFMLAMEGKGGPFSLVHDDEEFDDELDAAAAALLDAIFSDSDEADDDEDGPPDDPEPAVVAGEDEDFEDDAEGVSPGARTAKKTSKKTSKKTAKKAAGDADAASDENLAGPKKKTGKKTSKKTSTKAADKGDPEPEDDDRIDEDEA
jgi:sugar phosphate isomerase/epimerase